ncbi:uncharacterized protein J3D65DRAFT_168187 [Phyllosticta citribraziliensis]|uniref:Uncharacterized protein n=1 Tax=Phyllosticta citribraziliensis TaxID=989973 RepID=A0ABR1L495_9PEZI
MTASSNRGGTPNQQPHHRHNQHPQLRLPLSHHGLPRAPTSPSSSFSSRSNRYEALSNPHSSASSSATTTPTFNPHAGPKHQHNPSIASSSSASTQINASTVAADASQRAASFFRYSRTGDAPPSPPMTPFSPSAFPSEASTPMVLSPALPPQTAASDDSATQCCAHCRHCGGSVSEAAGPQQHQQLQMRSRSVEDVPSPVRRHASTRSLKHAESSVSSSSSASVEPPLVGAAGKVKRQQERSHSREGSKGVDRGRPEARGSDGPDASTCVGGGGGSGARADEPKTDKGVAAAPVLPPSSSSLSSSSSFSRMGKRIKAALGGPKKGAAAAAAVPSGVRYTGMDGKMDEWLGGILKCPPLVLCDAKSRGLLLFPCSFSAIFPNGVLSAGWLAGGVPVSVLIYVGCVAFIFSSLSSLCFSHVRPSLFPFQWQRLFSFASFVGGSVDAILQGVDTSAPSVLHGGRMEGRQTDRQAPLQSCISLRRAIVRLSSHASGHAGFIFALVLGALRQNVLF